MPTISVLYMVRNESQTIAQSLSSVASIADEIIIVDTGSTDDTVQICRQFRKTKIFTFAWENDFSKPRNFGISKCSMDWILYLDGDEALDKSSVTVIKKAVATSKSNVHGFGVKIVDREESFSSAPNPSSFFPSPQVRLFRRTPSILFSGVVMESVRDSIKAIGGGIDVLDARIDHWIWRGRGQGYAELRVKYYQRLGANLPMPSGVRDTGGRQAPPSPPPQAKVGIVIATMNALPATRQCLASVASNTSGAYETFVVDNCSIDGTPHVVAEMTGKKPIIFQKNEGVSKARNAGAFEAMRDPSIAYVCFLDNDTRVGPGWLDGMIAVMEEDPTIGVVGPISCSATGVQNVADQFSKRNYEDVHETAKLRAPSFVPTSKVNGFCMLVRVETLKKTGLFDETFGLYGCEADDFCRRAIKEGFGVGVANKVYVQHRGRATLDANRGDWQGCLANATFAYSKKWNDELPPDFHSMKSASGLAPMGSATLPHSRISVVVLSAGRPAMLKDCINSVMARTVNCEIIVAHTSAECGEFLATRPAVKEASGGWNAAIRETTSNYVVLLSDDMLVSSGWVGELFDLLETGLHVVSSDGCCMVRRSVFETVGLMDEQCGELACDDLAARAAASGMKTQAIQTDKTRRREARPATEAAQRRLAERGEFKAELLPVSPKKFRVMYLGPTYDHGVAERGLSYESDNFLPGLERWDKTLAMCHFDFVAASQKHGIAVMSDMLYEQAKAFCPDVVLAVMQDENHDPRKEVLRMISANLKSKTFGWFGDSNLRYSNYDKKWAPYLDFCVTTSKEAYDLYIAQGFCGKAIKSRWAASPKAAGTAMRKDIEVSCLNPLHYDRRRVVDELRRGGIAVYSPGDDKRLSVEEQSGIISRSKIVINMPSAADGRGREAGAKNLTVPACGGFLLTGVTEDLGEYFEVGREVQSYSDATDLAEKIKLYSRNDHERESIAAAGLARSAEHTWTARFDQVLKEAGLL